jgi:hypothetical protein
MHVICEDPRGRLVYSVGLRVVNGWDRGFESRSSSLVFVVWCIGSGLCDELITRSEEILPGVSVP